MKMTAQEYTRRVRRVGPHSPLGTDCLWAFCVGGGICLLGEILRQRYLAMGMEADLAGPVLAVARLAGCFRQAGLLLFAGLFAADSLIMAGLIALLLGYGLSAADCLSNRFYCRVMTMGGERLIYFACAINLTWVYIKYL